MCTLELYSTFGSCGSDVTSVIIGLWQSGEKTTKYECLYMIIIINCSDAIPGKLVLPVSGTRWNVEDQEDPLKVSTL